MIHTAARAKPQLGAARLQRLRVLDRLASLYATTAAGNVEDRVVGP